MCSSLLVGLGSGEATVVPAWKPGRDSPWEGLRVISHSDTGDKMSQRWPPCPVRLLEGRLILVILLSGFSAALGSPLATCGNSWRPVVAAR